MKRSHFVLAIVVLLTALAVFEYFAVKKILVHMENSVTQIKAEYVNNKDDITVLYDDISEIKNYWENRESRLCLMFNHKDLSSVSDALKRLTIYTAHNDYEKAIVEVVLLDGYTAKSQQVMGFNIHNIF